MCIAPMAACSGWNPGRPRPCRSRRMRHYVNRARPGPLDDAIRQDAGRANRDEPGRPAATVLRFPAVVGPNEYRRFQRWLQPMVRGVAELRVQDDWAAWRWTHGFAEDVAEAVVLAATNPAAAGRASIMSANCMRLRWRND